MTTPKQPLFLRIFKNGKLLDVKQFTGQQIVIGREGQVDALVNDPSVSPIHAMIEERDDGKFYLCDLGSLSGTFVNGEKIVDHNLETGSEFQLGDIKVEFHVGVPRVKKPGAEGTVVGAAAAVGASASAKPGHATPNDSVVTPVANAGAVKKEEPKKDDHAKDAHHQANSEAHKNDEHSKDDDPKPDHKKNESKAPKPDVSKPEIRALPKETPKREDKKTDAKGESKKSGGVTPLVTAPSFGGVAAGVSAGLSAVSSSTQSSRVQGKHTGKTFAPPSSVSMKKQLEPTKGNVVEVVLIWKDRILSTYHFDRAQTVSIGSHPKNEIILPTFGSVRLSHPLIRIEGSATVTTTQDMTGEVVTQTGTNSLDDLRKAGNLVTSGSGFSYSLQQGETMKVNIGEGVSLIIRYVESGPATRLIPLIDMSANQLTALVVSLMGTALFLFYAYLYAPALPEKADEEPEPTRKAQFIYKAPPKVVQLDETPIAHNAAEDLKTKAPPAPAQGEEGASGEPKKTANAQNKQARAKGTTKNAQTAAAPKTPPVPKPKDTSKMGLLGAFATKGTQDAINRANNAMGSASGAASNATGAASKNEGANGGGDALKDIGANGNGTATVGIAGVKTKGKGGGVSGYGTGSLGAKKNASLIAGDDQATFSGTIDKEAIRRVVQANLKQIKACYERGLNRNPGLYGKIVIQWTIGGGGHVLEAAIKTTTMDSAEVESCAVSRLRTWKFPEPPAGEVAVVSYPFVFQAQE